MRRRYLTLIGIPVVLVLAVLGAFLVAGGHLGANAQSAVATSTTSTQDSDANTSARDKSSEDATNCDHRAYGRVSAIHAGQLTLKSSDGDTVKVTVTGSTTYERDGVNSSFKAIHVNDYVLARGTGSCTGTVKATKVYSSSSQAHDGPFHNGFLGHGPSHDGGFFDGRGIHNDDGNDAAGSINS